MDSHDTQSPLTPATGQGRMASVTDIAQRSRSAVSPDAPAPLADDTVVGYFRHDGYCFKVEYVVPRILWLWVRAYEPDTGPLTDFAAYDRLEYQEYGSIKSDPGYLSLTYRGSKAGFQWPALSTVSESDLMRKALSLYAYITKGDMMNAADDLVPNPSPERIDPDAA